MKGVEVSQLPVAEVREGSVKHKNRFLIKRWGASSTGASVTCGPEGLGLEAFLKSESTHRSGDAVRFGFLRRRVTEHDDLQSLLCKITFT